MKDKYTLLARIMGDITTNILFASEEFNSLLQEQQLIASTRIGSGRATYCKFNLATKNICITYGKKMIESKFNPAEVIQWLSYREIIKHNYFQHNTSLVNVLTHTICHEFAHAIQQIQGKVYKGSIHNQHFYQILNEIHESGLADKTKEALLAKCEQYSIDLSYNKVNVCNLQQPMPEFEINDKIQFKHRNKLITARIIKINPKTLTVESKSLFKTTLWRVSKQQASLSRL